MEKQTRPLRIAPVPESQRTGQVRELLDQVTIATGGETNIFTTLVQAPGLFRRWIPFGGRLMNGKLPARDRELLILRTGWNCQSEYEWVGHAQFALLCGLSAEEVRRVFDAPDDPSWSEFDAALLRAADELHTTSTISDDTWSVLASHYQVDQLIEVPMLVGHYHMAAMTLNALGVQLDEDLKFTS
jgi:alkylhydroperoxidase family enzyme